MRNLDKIKRLAELKIEMDSMPPDSMPALSLHEEFNGIYRELESSIPHLYQSEIDELISLEIQKIKAEENQSGK